VLVAVLLACLPRSVLSEETSPLLVIVHPEDPATNISMDDLRRIFVRELTEWKDGSAILPLNIKTGTPERKQFDEQVLKTDEDHAKIFWAYHKARGSKGPPREAASVLLVQRAIFNTKGAIGYVRANQWTGDTKTLTVDGFASTDPRYPLRAP